MSAARFPGDPGPMSEWDPDQVIEANERHLEYVELRRRRLAKEGGPLLLAGKCWCYGLQSRHPSCAERARETA